MAKIVHNGQELRAPWGGAILVALALALGWHWYDRAGKPAQAQAPAKPLERPYVASESALSTDERLRLLVVPHPLGKPFNVTCVLYTSTAGAAQMVCPNATQEQLADVEDATPRGAR